jgi:hypothetical protein
VGGGAGRRKHPAFALDERGVWHSLTLSATQQLYGPVRLRADARLALDSVHPCPRGSGECCKIRAFTVEPLDSQCCGLAVVFRLGPWCAFSCRMHG